jgi:uncharacterized protein (DUF2252 family)
MESRPRQTVEQRSKFGKSLRKQAPRTSHGQWCPASARPDPIGLLEEQNKNRLDWLVPVRRARMMASPFAFYRGGARIMAADLSTTPVTGLTVQACGDAHLANFGLFASPERELVFDLNDFDETLEGPWEWDLKRLAASFMIAARHNQVDHGECRKATGRVVQSYREAMNDFAAMRTTDIWYALLKAKDIVAWADSRRGAKRVAKAGVKAKTKHSRQALDRLAEEVDGQYRIRSEPPLLVPLRELGQKLDRVNEKVIREAYEAYARGVSPDCRVLLAHFRPVDIALKVVGVGSVGTRCFILLLEGRDRDDPLFLQMKEATTSVLAEHLPPSPYENQGRRVVEGQRLVQTSSDIFLGWTHIPETGNDFYWRQLRDWKGAADIKTMRAADLNRYARLCGWTLARAHARSGDPVAIAGYLGSSDTFDQALTEFAERYADQNERDYQAFLEEIRSGRLEAASELS